MGEISKNGTNGTVLTNAPSDATIEDDMNKKKKDPEFISPFKDAQEEADRKFFDYVRMDYVSDKGSKVKLVQTEYSGKYNKLVLTETIYLKKDDKREKLSDVLALKPQDQIPREKYMVFDVVIDKKGTMRMTKAGNLDEYAEFNKNEAQLIMFFYQTNSVVLAKIPKSLNYVYTSAESIRQILFRINSKFKASFPALKDGEKKLISGSSPGKGYSFNSYVRLHVVKKSHRL